MDSGAGVLWEIFCSWEWDNNTDSWDYSPGFDKTTRRCGGHVEELLELTTAPPEKGGDGGAVDLWSWKGLKSEYIAPLTHNLWGMLSNSVHKYYEHNRKRIKTHQNPLWTKLFTVNLNQALTTIIHGSEMTKTTLQSVISHNLQGMLPCDRRSKQLLSSCLFLE